MTGDHMPVYSTWDLTDQQQVLKSRDPDNSGRVDVGFADFPNHTHAGL